MRQSTARFGLTAVMALVGACVSPQPPGISDASVDAGVLPDAGIQDAGFDAGLRCDSADGCPPDWSCLNDYCVSTLDSGVPDAGPIDAGIDDAGVPDAGDDDAGVQDAGIRDAGVVDAGPYYPGGLDIPRDCSYYDGGGTDICVQLNWDENYGDVDLHYIGPGGSFEETDPNEGDLDWMYSWATAIGPETPVANCGGGLGACSALNPDWGLNGIVAADGILTNNPVLFVDQRWGLGPEIAAHANPFDGTYQVDAHYFCSYLNEEPDGNSYGTVTAQVTIYAFGQALWSGTQAGLAQSEVWEAAQVVVSDGGTIVTVNPLDTPDFVSETGCVQ